MRPVYRLQIFRGARLVDEGLFVPSRRLPLTALVAAIEAAAPSDPAGRRLRVEAVEVDPATGQPIPRRRTPLDAALDELLGDLG